MDAGSDLLRQSVIVTISPINILLSAFQDMRMDFKNIKSLSRRSSVENKKITTF